MSIYRWISDVVLSSVSFAAHKVPMIHTLGFQARGVNSCRLLRLEAGESRVTAGQ